MVVKVYVSGISGNKEVKKRQQRVSMILESKHIDFVTVDITEPGKEEEKEFMQQKSNAKDAKHPLPPQMFNDEEYCGDYDEFDLANEMDELEKFLKVAPAVSKADLILNKTEDKLGGGDTVIDATPLNGQVNGNTSSREQSAEKEPEVPAPALEERRVESMDEDVAERTEEPEVEEETEEEEEEEEGASEQ